MYYEDSSSIISDAVYDRLCRVVTEHISQLTEAYPEAIGYGVYVEEGGIMGDSGFRSGYALKYPTIAISSSRRLLDNPQEHEQVINTLTLMLDKYDN